MNEDAGALDVFEELHPEAGAEVCACDEAGDISDSEAALKGSVAYLHDAKVGLERGEFIVRNLGTSGGETRDERGLADIREADEAGIREQTKFQAIVASFAGAAEFVLARSLVCGCSEVLVAAAAATTTCDDELIVGSSEVVNEIAGVVVIEQSADRNFEDERLAGGAGHVGAEAMTAALGLVFRIETEVDKCVVRKRRLHENIAAVAAVSA